MNRIFHVKIAGGTYLFLILLTAVMVFAFWCMKAMIGLVVALGLIITIERIIHSTQVWILNVHRLVKMAV